MAIIFGLFILAIAVLLAMAFSALSIGAANAWFLSGNFSDGWNLAWHKPWVLLGWTLLFMVLSHIKVNSK